MTCDPGRNEKSDSRPVFYANTLSLPYFGFAQALPD